MMDKYEYTLLIYLASLTDRLICLFSAVYMVVVYLVL